MKKIPLTQGLFALVDDADYAELSRHKWYAHRDGRSIYARRGVIIAGKHCVLRMHRVIMGDAATGLQIDHCDGDGLNNQRANLRVCTSSQNNWNQQISKANTTGFKGVSRPARLRGMVNCHVATIQLNGKRRYLGRFPTAEQAHAAYCEAAKKLHGEFARFE